MTRGLVLAVVVKEADALFVSELVVLDFRVERRIGHVLPSLVVKSVAVVFDDHQCLIVLHAGGIKNFSKPVRVDLSSQLRRSFLGSV